MMCTVLPAVVSDPANNNGDFISLPKIARGSHGGTHAAVLEPFHSAWSLLCWGSTLALIDFPFSRKCGHELTQTFQNQAEKQ